MILYLHSGHPVDVHVRELKELPGFVRKVTVYPDGLHVGYMVGIEYELASLYVSRDFEGPHLKYGLEYEDLDRALQDIESYLNIPIERWVNFTKTPLLPTTLDDPNPPGSQGYFEQLAQQGDLQLPNGTTYPLFGTYEDPDADPEA